MEVAAERRYSPNIVEIAEYLFAKFAGFAEIRQKNRRKIAECLFAEYSPLPTVGTTVELNAPETLLTDLPHLA